VTVLPATQIYQGTRIPSPCPTILEIDPEKHSLEDILTVNFGPNHPSTHGVLRLIVDLDGERIAGIRAVIGYLHTGFEKTMEHKTYWKGITYPERIDYLSFQSNELVFVLAIEKLLELETPEKATWMRMCLAELNRIHSHLVWLGTSALEIGAISMFWYAFRERDMILDLFEMVTGVRMHTRYFQVGGLAEDIPEGFYAQARAAAKRMPKAVDDYEGLLDRNKIWLERTKGIGLLSADDALALGQSGPMVRASGIDWDLRRATPYLAYDEVEFDVPVYANGDVYDRYKVHMDEMRQSARIVTQCVDRLEALRGKPWIADDRKVVLPPREELHTSMESLIHHFKIVTEGYRVPEGEVYVAIESARGEQGCYLVADGGPKPWRVHFRAPSFAALQATATCIRDAAIADMVAVAASLDPVMGDVDR
jgi:NADH-quinone oxidoreductase subunit D